MKRKIKYYSIAVLLIVFSGCNELVQVTGNIMNRLNYHSLSGGLVVSVHDYEGNFVSGVQISVIRANDSTCVFTPKFTNNSFPVYFWAPDEQINTVESDTARLNIVAFHPENGIFIQQISVTSINPDKPLFLEFLMNSSENYPPPDKLKYQKFKY